MDRELSKSHFWIHETGSGPLDHWTTRSTHWVCIDYMHTHAKSGLHAHFSDAFCDLFVKTSVSLTKVHTASVYWLYMHTHAKSGCMHTLAQSSVIFFEDQGVSHQGLHWLDAYAIQKQVVHTSWLHILSPYQGQNVYCDCMCASFDLWMCIAHTCPLKGICVLWFCVFVCFLCVNSYWDLSYISAHFDRIFLHTCSPNTISFWYVYAHVHELSHGILNSIGLALAYLTILRSCSCGLDVAGHHAALSLCVGVSHSRMMHAGARAGPRLHVRGVAFADV